MTLLTPSADTTMPDSQFATAPEMAHRNGHTAMPEPNHSAAGVNGTAGANGASAIPPQGDGAAQADETTQEEGPSSLDRAEQLADRIGVAVGMIATVVGRSLIHFAARTRETLSDCWAEAQNIRRGEKNDPPAS